MGLILGAVIAIVTSTNWSILVTKENANRMVHNAVLQTRAAICVAQFNKDPQVQQKTKEFKTLGFMERDAFLGKGGWDRMPGDEKAQDGVNRVCGDKLAAQFGVN
jgi:hypothetical protein